MTVIRTNTRRKMILLVHPFTTGKFTIFFAAYHPQVINPVVGWITVNMVYFIRRPFVVNQ